MLIDGLEGILIECQEIIRTVVTQMGKKTRDNEPIKIRLKNR